MMRSGLLSSLSMLFIVLAWTLVVCTGVVYADVISPPELSPPKVVVGGSAVGLWVIAIPVGLVIVVSFLAMRAIRKKHVAETK